MAAVAAEGGLRLSGRRPDPSLFTVTEREFQRVPGIYSPNQRVVVQPGTAFAHTVSINSLGYRGPDFPLARRPGELRVLFAGDSFTWGHNVEDDETLPAQLEDRLSLRCGAVRVANAGLAGSTILGQREMVLRGLAIEPDVVVVMYHENDIGELVHTRIWEQLAGNRSAKSRFPLRFVYPLVRETALWNLALQATHSHRIEAGLQGRERHANESAATDAARAEYRTLLASLARVLEDRGVPLLFAAYPHPESVVAGRAADDYYTVLQAAADMSLVTLDLMQPLLDSGMDVADTFLLPLDYHPTPTGYAIAADAMADAVTRITAGRCR